MRVRPCASTGPTSSPWQEYFPRKSRVGNFKRQVSDCSNAAPTTPENTSSSINAPSYGGFATWSAYLESKMDWRVEEAALGGCYISLTPFYSFTMYKINYAYDNAPPTERVEAYFIYPSAQKSIHMPKKTYGLCNIIICLCNNNSAEKELNILLTSYLGTECSDQHLLG